MLVNDLEHGEIYFLNNKSGCPVGVQIGNLAEHEGASRCYNFAGFGDDSGERKKGL